MENSRLSKVERLFKEHLPAYRDWHLTDWLEWADHGGLIVRVFPNEREEELLAAAVVRPISFLRLAEPYDSYAVDQRGDVLYIDAAVATSKNALRCLALGVIQRFGPRRRVAFRRQGEELKIHSYQNARKALLK